MNHKELRENIGRKGENALVELSHDQVRGPAPAQGIKIVALGFSAAQLN